MQINTVEGTTEDAKQIAVIVFELDESQAIDFDQVLTDRLNMNLEQFTHLLTVLGALLGTKDRLTP